MMAYEVFKFRLDFVHGSDVTRLDVIFNFANLFLKFFNGNLQVLNYNHYLKKNDSIIRIFNWIGNEIIELVRYLVEVKK